MKKKNVTIEPLTIEQAIRNGNDGQNQDIKSRFVGQHVYANVNTLVEYIISKGFEDSEAPFSLDDVENYYSFPEWSAKVQGETLEFDGGTQEAKDEFLENFERLENESQELLDNEEISEETHERNLELIQEAKESFEESTEESEPSEIFEWWAVSEFLYRKLKEQGYCVLDAGSCYVWGRCTTGQAILLDGVITRICADMGILEGQSNSWAKTAN
jgi:hypothetical protein